MNTTIEDVLMKHLSKSNYQHPLLAHEKLLVYKAMQEWASLNSGEENQEKLWDEVEDIFDKHTSPTGGGGYEADYTYKHGFISELKEKYLLMPLPNKPNP